MTCAVLLAAFPDVCRTGGAGCGSRVEVVMVITAVVVAMLLLWTLWRERRRKR